MASPAATKNSYIKLPSDPIPNVIAISSVGSIYIYIYVFFWNHEDPRDFMSRLDEHGSHRQYINI